MKLPFRRRDRKDGQASSRAAALPEYALVFSLIAAGSVGAFQMLEDRGGDVIDDNSSAIGARPEVQSLYDAQVAAGLNPATTFAPPTTVPPATTTTAAPATTAAPTTTTPATTVPVSYDAIVSLSDESYYQSSGKYPVVRFTFIDAATGTPLVGAATTFTVPKYWAADGYKTVSCTLDANGQCAVNAGVWYYQSEYPFDFTAVSATLAGNTYTLTGTTAITLTY